MTSALSSWRTLHTCSTCGKTTLGTVWLVASKATRRCSNCFGEETIHLPALHKKIVYLDQNAISNLAHTRHATGKSPDGPIWHELNERLTRTVQRQLVVCPVSFNHQIESAVAERFESFMETGEYFGGACSFLDFNGIRAHQIAGRFSAYIDGLDNLFTCWRPK